MTIVFKIIDKTVGLRVTEEEEIVGLDVKEHGLASAYAGFSLMDITEGSLSMEKMIMMKLQKHRELHLSK